MQKDSNSYHYVLWVIILSIPFYLIGELGFELLPLALPSSAFMVICPTLAIWPHQSLMKLKEITLNSFRLRAVSFKGYLLAILTMPCVLVLQFYVMNYLVAELPTPQIAIADIGVLTLLFFASSITEEIGWTGYLTNDLLKKYSVILTGSIIGFVWAVWHLIPYHQMGRELDWITWQCAATLLNRIVMVWLFVKFNRSVFITILFHTVINLSIFIFPIKGSCYDPFYFSVIFIGFIKISYFIFKPSYLIQKLKSTKSLQ